MIFFSSLTFHDQQNSTHIGTFSEYYSIGGTLLEFKKIKERVYEKSQVNTFEVIIQYTKELQKKRESDEAKKHLNLYESNIYKMEN